MARSKIANPKSKIQNLSHSNLRTHVIGAKIVVRKRAASTMDLAAEYASRGFPEGTVVFALEQTAGRGRFGARWWSPPGASLLFSVALWPRAAQGTPALLTLAGAVSVAEVLRRSYRMDARIRWPNDVVVDGRKIAGVLVETRRTSRLHPTVVLGVGLNLNVKRREIPPDLARTATSVLVETGAAADPTAAARSLLRCLDRWYKRLLEKGPGPLIKRWRRLSSTLGKRVVLDEKGRIWRGRVTGITAAGQLAVKLDSGAQHLFRAERTRLVSER
jgi:BirA family biotin operon repressor/biotin-[acetyl-CoA-carboxylase] ligase